MRNLIFIVFFLFLIYSTESPKRKHENEPFYFCKNRKIIRPYLFSSQNNYHNPSKNYANNKTEHRKDLTSDSIKACRTIKSTTKFETKCISTKNNLNRLEVYNGQNLPTVLSTNREDFYGTGLNSDELDDLLTNGFDNVIDESFSLQEIHNQENIKSKNINQVVSIDTFSSTSEASSNLLIEEIINTLDQDSAEDENLVNEKQGLSNLRIGDVTNDREVKSGNIVSIEYIKTLKSDVEQFIAFHIPKHYRNVYFERLIDIDNVIKLTDKLKIQEQKSFFVSIDKKLEESLRLMTKTFDKNSKFNEQTSNLFINDLFFETKEISTLFTLKGQHLSYEEKVLSFYFEYIKLYRYTIYIPEILTVGGVFTDKLSHDPTFVLHLMNLFIQKIGNIEDNSVFIKCLIQKAFSYSLKNRVKLFMIQKILIKCNRKYKDIFFFAWEIDSRIRQMIKNKSKEGDFYESNCIDEIHMKTVLLLFLYQHVIFLKCNYVTIKDIHTLSSLFVRLKLSDECFVCIFDDFMKLLKSQIHNIKD